MMRLRSRLFLLLAATHSVQGFTKYFMFCSLTGHPVIHVNATVLPSGEIKLWRVGGRGGRSRGRGSGGEGVEQGEENNNNTRSLRRTSKTELQAWLANDKSEPLYTTTSQMDALRLLADVDGNSSVLSENSAPGTTKLLRVRECICAPQNTYSQDFYCPADLDYCAVPGPYYSTPAKPVCLNVDNDEIFVRSIWPIILIWFALTLVFCVFTWSGRNACDYLIAACFPFWNQTIFEQAICYNSERTLQQANRQQDRSFWEHMIHTRRVHFQNRYRGIVGRARMAEDGIASNSYEYEFRTRIFKSDPQQQQQQQTNEDPQGGVSTATKPPAQVPPPGAATNRTITASTAATSDNELEEYDDDDEYDGASCAICFLKLEDGDRVGAIDCQHLFHVDCLKGWLQRRNVCPLCMQEGIARPRGQHMVQRRQSRQDVSHTSPGEAATDESRSDYTRESENANAQHEA